MVAPISLALMARSHELEVLPAELAARLLDHLLADEQRLGEPGRRGDGLREGHLALSGGVAQGECAIVVGDDAERRAGVSGGRLRLRRMARGTALRYGGHAFLFLAG
jgi:hypothetical protein